MFVGYARVSTEDQTLDFQLDALKSGGCDRIHKDVAGGTTAQRAGLERALYELRAGDTLVVWRLDRLGRSLTHLINTVSELKAKGIGFRSLTEHIDTTTPSGQLIFHIFGALAEFERSLIRERTLAGLAAARARGRTGGRPALEGTDSRVQLAAKLFDDKTNKINDICRTLSISRATLYRYVAHAHENRVGGGPMS